MHLHTEIYPNLKSLSELFKMYMKSLDSCILASRDNLMESRATRHSAVSAFTETVEFLQCSLVSYCCSMIGCYFFLDIIGSQKRIAPYNFHII